MCQDLQPGDYAYWKRYQIKNCLWPHWKGPYQASPEWTTTPVSDIWLQLRPVLPDKKKTTSEVDSWPKILLWQLLTFFAYELNVFLGLNHMKVSKISLIADFVASHLCLVLPGCLGGFLLAKTLSKWWSSEIVLYFKTKKLYIMQPNVTTTNITKWDPGQLMMPVLNLAINTPFH